MAHLIADILAWAETHPSFDTTFTRSVQSYLHKRGRLTPAQLTALQNIHTRYDIASAVGETRPPPYAPRKWLKLEDEEEPSSTAEPSVPYTRETLMEYWAEHARLNAAWYDWMERRCS